MVLGLSAILFSACKKESYLSPDRAYPIGQQAKTTTDEHAVLKIEDGNFFTAGITVRDNENIYADIKDLRLWNFSDDANDAGLNVPPGSYSNLATAMALRAFEGNPSMRLFGTIRIVNDMGEELMKAPVEFRMDEQLELQTGSGAIDFKHSSKIRDLLNLHLDDMGTGISAEMWSFATRNNANTILVSPSDNTGIYQMMLKNLKAMADPNTAAATTSAAGPIAGAGM
jgi:hypothetical protein